MSEERDIVRLQDALSRHNGNMLTHSLGCAEKIATAMCLLDTRAGHHGAMPHLIDSLHSALIVAEEARQQWADRIGVER